MVRRFVIASLVLLASSSAFAQSSPYEGPPAPGKDDICTPYTAVGCPGAPEAPAENPLTNPDNGVAKVIDFPQVFLGVHGLEHTFVSIKNKSEAINPVTIEVTVEGRQPVSRVLVLQPGERVSERISGWANLAGEAGGASVVVRAQHDATAGIAMHPNDLTTFWTGARILEGR